MYWVMWQVRNTSDMSNCSQAEYILAREIRLYKGKHRMEYKLICTINGFLSYDGLPKIAVYLGKWERMTMILESLIAEEILEN